MDAELIISKLPAFQGNKVLIKKNQTVADIIAETLESHELFAADYDRIAYYFQGNSGRGTLEKIFNFLKLNVRYREEPERNQQIKSPAAVLQTGVCDCKSYAHFIGGVLDALNRQGGNYDWFYAFASYNKRVSVPGHVFVICNIDGKQYWVDPVLKSFDARFPSPESISGKKKIDTMALYRVSGVNNSGSHSNGANPAVGAIPLEPCQVSVREGLDQQLLRLTNCEGTGSMLTPIQYETTKQVYYELPKGSPVNAPIDATVLEPGSTLTPNPAPAVSITNENILPPANGDKGFAGWIKQNPLVAAGAAAVVVYLVTRKKRRR